MIDGNGHLMIAAWLATYLIHSTILLGLAWLVAGRLLRSRDDVAEMIWKLAIVTPLVSATMQVALGVEPVIDGFVIEHPRPTGHVVSSDRAPTATSNEMPSGPAESPTNSSIRTWPDRPLPLFETDRAHEADTESVHPSVVPAETVGSIQAAPGEPPEPTIDAFAAKMDRGRRFIARYWRGAVFALVSVLIILPLLREGLAWTLLRRRLARRSRITDGPLVELLDQLRQRAGARQNVRLTSCPGVDAPMSFGILRPEICVPRDIVGRLSRVQLKSMLAHELAHLRRYDPAWLAVIRFIESALPFQPLNRLAGRRLRELSELNCDAWAAAQTGDRLTLAHCLTEVAGWMVGRREIAGPIGMAGQASTLRRRVERLLDERCGARRRIDARWLIVLAPILTTAAVMAGPRVSAAIPESEFASPTEPLAASRHREAMIETTPDLAPDSVSHPLDDLVQSLRDDLDLLDRRVEALGEASPGIEPTSDLDRIIEELVDRTTALRDRADRLESLWNEYADASAHPAAEHARRFEPNEPDEPTERSGDS